MLKLALSLSADGIILFVHGTAEHSAKMLRSLTLPVILIDRGVPGTERIASASMTMMADIWPARS